MFKYDLEEIVFTIFGGMIYSAPVLSRSLTENSINKCFNTEQTDAFHKLGESRIVYATIHGVFDESRLFKSKEDLIEFAFDVKCVRGE